MSFGFDAIVVSYKTPFDLAAFIASYAAYPPSVWNTLWVVNVDSNPEEDQYFVELLAATNFSYRTSWNYVPTTENIGYSGAVNMAARDGENDYLAAFNADTRITANVVDHCLELMQADAGIGIVGPKQVDDQDRLTHAGIVGTNEQPRFRCWLDFDRGQFDDVIEVITVSGSAYFVRRETWNELSNCPIYADRFPTALGAFLPTPHFYEETWCSYHARAHGWRVVYDGAAKMVHRWHQSTPIGGVAESEYFPKSQRIFRSMCDAHSILHD